MFSLVVNIPLTKIPNFEYTNDTIFFQFFELRSTNKNVIGKNDKHSIFKIVYDMNLLLKFFFVTDLPVEPFVSVTDL